MGRKMSDISAYLEHVNFLSDLFQGLIVKSMAEDLGPADGRLYMQLCDFFTAHAEKLEAQTREANEQSGRDTSGDSQKDSGSEGDKSSDSES